jgi:hypothetical protein
VARACRRAARALLPLTGGFVYFDAADRICQINAFAAYQDLRNGGLDDGSFRSSKHGSSQRDSPLPAPPPEVEASQGSNPGRAGCWRL